MDEEIKKLVEKNLELTEEIHRMTKKINSFIAFQKVMSVVYFLLIVIPLILSFIYLPPLIGNIVGQYQDLLGNSSTGSIESLLEGINLK